MNALEALRPVTCFFQFLGMTVTTCRENKNIPLEFIIKCYSLLVIAIRFSLFFFVSINGTLFKSIKKGDPINLAINIALICSTYLLEMSILIEAFIKARQEEKFMKNLLEIDRILMHHFDIDLKMSELKRSAIKQLLIWISIIGLFSGFLLIKHYNTAFFIYSLNSIPSYFSASLLYFQIISWSDLIRYRLYIVNRLIRHQHKTIEKSNKIVQKSSDTPLQMANRDSIENSDCGIDCDEEKLKSFYKFSDLYNRLWIQTNLINERFKFSVVLTIGNDFILLVSQIFFVVICIKKFLFDRFFKVHILVIIIKSFHLIMLCRAGQNVTDEAFQIAYGIHRYKHDRHNTRLCSFVRVNYFQWKFSI